MRKIKIILLLCLYGSLESSWENDLYQGIGLALKATPTVVVIATSVYLSVIKPFTELSSDKEMKDKEKESVRSHGRWL